MRAAARTLSRNSAAFILSAGSIVAICLVLLRSSAIAREPDLLYYGITFDFCLTVPFLYWFFLIRSGRVAAMTIVPLFIACTAIATAIVPVEQRDFLRALTLLQLPLELWIVSTLVVRFRSARRQAASEDDPLLRIRMIASEILGANRAAEALVAEVAAVYFGVAGWRLRREIGENETTFHVRSGWGSIVACIAVLIVAESIAVHLFVQQWSTAVAWVITALDVYSIVWLIGDYHAFRLRPTRVTDETIELRFGMRWSADIPRTLVESVEPLSADDAERLRGERDYLRLSILDEPTMLLTLRAPVTVTGLLGWKKVVTRIGLRPDNPELIERLTRGAGALARTLSSRQD